MDTFKHILVFYMLSLFNSSKTESSDVCEVYHIVYASKTLHCDQYERTQSHSFKGEIVKDSCNASQTKKNSSDYDRVLDVRNFNNGLCPLRPRIFDFLSRSGIKRFKTDSLHAVLQNDTFFGLFEVEDIDLSNKGIKIIEPYTFRCAKKIISLFLSDNEIEHLPTEVFKDMRLLQRLRLASNLLSTIALGTFDELASLKKLDLTSSLISSLPDGIFHHLTSLDYLNLYNNNLETLNPNVFSNNMKIRLLHLGSNKLKSVTNKVIPQNLKFLNLSGNKLKTLPETVKEHAQRVNGFTMALSNNLFPCDCSILPLKTWLLQNLKKVIDAKDVRCIFSTNSLSTLSLTMIDDFQLCSQFMIFVYLMIVLVILALVAASSLVIYYKHKYHILCLLYTYCNCFFRVFCRQTEEDKMFDCFISYSSEDRDVAFAILEELEEKPPCYKFCIHERNWLAGSYITNNIFMSVQNSRKTLIILSQTFVKSNWFYLEFQAAYQQTLKDKKDRLILVVKGDLPDRDELDEDVNFVISSKTYLVWGEKWFFQKLSYSIYEENFLTRKRGKCNLENIMACFRRKNIPAQNEHEMEEEVFCSRTEEDKMFDCFISYSSEDRDVTFAILEELETKPPCYKFCIHERNWLAGSYITNNIFMSVHHNRKTLIILSQTFVKSEWFYLEFQAAYQQTLKDKKDRLILVVKGDLPDRDELDEDVNFVISSKTYLVWGEKCFFQKLRYSIYEENFLTRKK